MDSLLCDEVWLCSPTTTPITTTTATPGCRDEPSCKNAGSCCLCCDSACFNSITKEECQHSLAMFIDKEATYMLPEPAAYLHHLHRSKSLLLGRSTAVQLLLKSCSRLNLSVSTVFSAANYLDRFMSMHRALEWETWMVELVTVACLSVASKFNETNTPSLYDFQIPWFKSETEELPPRSFACIEELASSNPHYSDLTNDIVARLLDHIIHKDDVMRCHGKMMEMEMEIDSSSCSSRLSPWSPVTVLCIDCGVGVNSRGDSHVDLSIFCRDVGSGSKLGNKKKRKWEDVKPLDP